MQRLPESDPMIAMLDSDNPVRPREQRVIRSGAWIAETFASPSFAICAGASILPPFSGWDVLAK
jgi:hypothetical protein